MAEDYNHDDPDRQQFFIGNNDWAFLQGINKEFISEVVDTPVNYFKILPSDTFSNLYGESEDGKFYEHPMQIEALLQPEDQETDRQDSPGPTREQSLQFAFQREVLRKNDFYPREGDIIQWSNLYWEVKEIVDNKLLGSKFHYRHGVTVRSVLTRDANINLTNEEERR